MRRIRRARLRALALQGQRPSGVRWNRCGPSTVCGWRKRMFQADASLVPRKRHFGNPHVTAGASCRPGAHRCAPTKKGLVAVTTSPSTILVGMRGFEPPASASRTLRSSQAEPHPVEEEVFSAGGWEWQAFLWAVVKKSAFTYCTYGQVYWGLRGSGRAARAHPRAAGILKVTPGNLAHATEHHCKSHASSGAGTFVPVEGGTRRPDVL